MPFLLYAAYRDFLYSNEMKEFSVNGIFITLPRRATPVKR
jgi:hypothetical protein